MSTLNPTRKVSRRHELREDTVITFYARAIDFFENNRNVVYGVLGGIVLLAALIVGWNWNQANRNETALSEMAEAVRQYEAGSYQAALDGDLSFTGLVGRCRPVRRHRLGQPWPSSTPLTPFSAPADMVQCSQCSSRTTARRLITSAPPLLPAKRPSLRLQG